MLGDAQLVAFVAASDVEAARAFYGGVLELTLVEDQMPFALIFDANGTTLRVTAVEAAVVAPYTVLGWRVDDIASTVIALRDRGVVFLHFPNMEQDDLGVWTAPGGSRVAWFHDPAGHTLSLTQHP